MRALSKIIIIIIIITYPQGKWKKARSKQSTFYPKQRKGKNSPIGDVRDRRRERNSRVYVLSRVCTNRVSLYYRKRGSASYIVRQWLLWEVERERDACDVIDITLKSRVIMHMITSTVRRPNASTRSEPVERSNFDGACKNKELGAWALDWAAGSSDWWTTMGKWKLCVRWSDCRGSPSSISLACFKQLEE